MEPTTTAAATTIDTANSKLAEPALCQKCKQFEPIVKLNFKEPQCEQCFLTYIRHKFRANLGCTKIVARGANVLVTYDGRTESSVLLHLIQFACTLTKFKKLAIKPYVLYIDDTCCQLQQRFAADDNNERYQRRADHITEVFRLCSAFGMPAHYTTVADYPHVDMTADTATSMNYEHLFTVENCFTNTLNEIGSLSARQDFLHCRREKITRKVAEHLKCPYVFTAETCPDLAIKLLANIALGRGNSVSHDVSFCDTRSSSVQIIRPIMDFDGIDISTYVQVNAIECLPIEKLMDDGSGNSAAAAADDDAFGSIQNLTKFFIDDLQVNFQSTVSTVFRTGNKLAKAGAEVVGQATKSGTSCFLCGSNRDDENSATLQAIEYSRNVSTTKLNDCDGAGHNNNNKDIKVLCHACSNMFLDCKEDSNIFNYI